MGKLMLTFAVLVLAIRCHNEGDTSDHRANETASSTGAENPDIPYQQFCQGYEALDAALVTSTYTKDALLINVYNGSAPTSFQGYNSIDSFFVSTFAQALERNVGLQIHFKLSSRQEKKGQILDNGFYKLSVSSADRAVDHRYGKFSIVLQQEQDSWKFAIDTNASATEEEYRQAVGSLIGSEGRR